MGFETEQEYEKELLKKAEQSQKDTFDSWIVDLEEKDQPEACNIDDPECDNCGS